MTSASDIKTLLRNNSALREIMVNTRRLSLLQKQVEQYLQEAARPHCKVAALRDDCLVLVITDGAWATRLRYQKNRIIKQLRNLPAFATLQHIHFKVVPHTEPPLATRERPVLSVQAAEVLESAASHTTNLKLQAAFRRLARHAQPTIDRDNSQ